MPSCCRCNRTGRCKNCSCSKAGKRCIDCIPSLIGTCQNVVEQSQEEPTITSEDQRNNIEIDNSESIFSEDQKSEQIPDGSHANIQPLPPYQTANKPIFKWGNLSGESFCQEVTACYKSMVHWKKLFFPIPRGSDGDHFVKELARLLRLYADKSSCERIAMTTAMIFPPLMLMRLSKKSKPKDDRACLKRRLELWERGEIRQLSEEAEALQRRLSTNTPPPKKEPTAKRFGNLMRNGKIKDAKRLLNSNTNSSKPLKTSDVLTGKTVMDILLEKHPEGAPLHPNAISPAEQHHHNFHPIIFDTIDGTLIRSIALRAIGSAGPSGLDARNWRRICTSFSHHSNDLCEAIAAVSRRLCTEYVDPDPIESLMACRLIALNKNPGVRPIGVAETLRRIIGKAIISTISEDLQIVAGCIQLCAGQVSGIEAAIHAMNVSFEDAGTEAALLVDASNAFNSLNREVALRNIQNLCPALATIATNTYRMASPLFIDNQTITSQEGTTQGDPLAMAIYAVALRPLIDRVQNASTQIWYADDAGASGKLTDLRQWWNNLVTIGPNYGYHTNALKSVVITKPNHLEEATKIFSGSGMRITTDGAEYLGAPIGSETYRATFIKNKISEWVNEIESLSIIARTEPQATYASFTHSIISEWQFLTRTVPL